MKTTLLLMVLLFLASCSSSRIERKIEDVTWDSLADESYLRWGSQRLKAARTQRSVVDCYRGKTDETLALYKREYLTRKDDQYYWLHVGNCYFVEEKWSKAEFFYRQALEEAKAGPIKSIALNNLGLISFKHEQWEKGKDFLRDAIAAAPKFKVPKFNLSQLYIQFGFYDKAIETLNDSVFRGDKDVDVYFSLANAHFYKGDLAEADKYFKLVPKDAFSREDIAATYALYLIKKGNLSEARRIMKDRERSGVVELTQISQQIEKILSQRTKEE